MELRFTDHARRRIRQRHIDEAEVGEVLADPDERRPSEGRPDRTIVIGTSRPAGCSSSSSSATTRSSW